MKAESSQNIPADESEETLVAPRFDEVETVQAQPVVPLADAPPHTNGGRPLSSRFRSWPLALVLVSALVGSVLGGAGLYLYQRRANARMSVETQPTSPTAPNEAAQPPVTVPEESAALPPQSVEPAVEPEETTANGPAKMVEPPAPENPKATGRTETLKTPAPEPASRRVEREEDSGAARRGKKGERDEDSRPRAERVGAREEQNDGEARLADEIIYRRERRAERRARRENRQRSVDRVRGIFEGQPE